jgi:hypothetical protein
MAGSQAYESGLKIRIPRRGHKRGKRRTLKDGWRITIEDEEGGGGGKNVLGLPDNHPSVKIDPFRHCFAACCILVSFTKAFVCEIPPANRLNFLLLPFRLIGVSFYFVL